MTMDPNFYNYNYYDTLSDSIKKSLDHNHHYSTKKIDLHKIRETFYNSTFKSPLHEEWMVDCQDPNYTYESKFSISDTPERHQELFKDKLETKILANNGYAYLDENTTWKIKDNVRYRYNSMGFRSPELSDTPCIAFFGCSHTFGTGLDQEHIWPEVLCKQLGMRSVNIGFPARGIDMSAIYAKYFFKAEIKNCKAIIIFLPPPTRKSTFQHVIDPYKNKTRFTLNQMEWLDSNREDYYGGEPFSGDIQNGMAYSSTGNDWQIENETKLLMAQDILEKHNTFERTSTAISDIELLAKDLNIPLLTYSTFTDVEIGTKQSIEFARDNMHGGKNIHDAFANKVAQELNAKLDK